MTAQEDNATLGALLRGAKSCLIDFSRIIIMRSGSEFDRPYPGLSCSDNLFYADQGGFLPSLANLYLAGTPIVKGILEGWNKTFEHGVVPTNYIGDIFGTLGGRPDFGPGGRFNDNPVTNTPSTAAGKKDLNGVLIPRKMQGVYDEKGVLGVDVARAANGNA